jgi:cellulose biosynthesis protein BcsQ
MEKISIILADLDEIYLDKLTNYFIEKTHRFDVYSFTSKDSLAKYINDGMSTDIILFTEDFIDNISNFDNISVKILLSNSSNYNAELCSINKYQKTEKMIKEILIIYAEKTGKVGNVSNINKKTKIIGVYSPVGGCGKTTISLALSKHFANVGKKVFYLNYEVFNSTSEFLNYAPKGNFSDIFLSLKTKGSNVALQIISNQYKDEKLKVSYINPPESALEFNELTTQEKIRLIHEIDAIGEFDVVVIDFDSDFNEQKHDLLEACDVILMPFTMDFMSLSKIRILMKEIKMRKEMNGLIAKTHLAVNKVHGSTKLNVNDVGIFNLESPDVIMPLTPALSDVNNLFYAIGTMPEIFSVFVSKVLEGR